MTATRLSFEAIGTQWAIDIFSGASADTVGKLEKTVRVRIDAFDKYYSRFRDDSFVSKLSRKAGTFTLPEDARPLLDLYQKLYKVSRGAVTPLIGQTLVEAGYDASYSLQPGTLHAPPAWEKVIDYDFPRLTMKRPALLDFGAAGKGYIVDIIGQLLEESGVQAYCINAGGDILEHSDTNKPIAIGLEHPADSTMAVGVAHIHNQSLCGSAGNRRAWGMFHHIIDPRSLSSPRHITAAWAVAGSALLADGLTTALFFVEPEALRDHFEFEYALIKADGSLEKSGGFPAEFFVQQTNGKIG